MSNINTQTLQGPLAALNTKDMPNTKGNTRAGKMVEMMDWFIILEQNLTRMHF